MSYEIDPNDANALVFSGQEDGIADSPYAGVSDIRNINIVTIPGEASVNFETAKISSPVVANGSVTSANAGTYYLTYTGAANLENNMAINFTAESGLGVTANLQTTYWVFNVGGAGAGTFQICANYITQVAVHVTNGTGTFTVYQVGTVAATGMSGAPVGFAYEKHFGKYFMLDAVGQVWSNYAVTGTSSAWTYLGSTPNPTPNNTGAGIVLYQSSNGDEFLFIFRDQSIDYLTIYTATLLYPQWTYGWNPADGSTVNANGYLNADTLFHRAILAPDNKVYYCDGQKIGRFYQSDTQGYTQITYTSLSGTLNEGDVISDGSASSLYTKITYTALTGSLVVGDTIHGANGVTGTIQSFTSTTIVAYTPVGTFSTSGTLTDATSGASATIGGTYVLGVTGTIISYTGSTIIIETPSKSFASSGTLTDLTSGATATISSTTTFGFIPTNTSTYTFDTNSILPNTDAAQCLTALGNGVFSLLIGGRNNIVYQWDTFSINVANSPILLPESNVINLVTVGGNCYIFTGNRGRIYITNGSQAQFYKKIPDHLSGTVEPYFQWGAAMSNKNQLYFSASVTNNAGTALTTMGGIWAIDLDSKYGGQYAVTSAGPLRYVNQLSYTSGTGTGGTYPGYVTAIIPNFGSDPAGAGFFAGWDDGSFGYGIDTTVSTPYTGGQSYIDYDLVPIGTFYKPVTPKTVEFKLNSPLVAGESVQILYRKTFNSAYTSIFTSNTIGAYSDLADTNFDNAQWVQLRAVLTSTATNPSYVRLTELRIKPNQ